MCLFPIESVSENMMDNRLSARKDIAYPFKITTNSSSQLNRTSKNAIVALSLWRRIAATDGNSDFLPGRLVNPHVWAAWMA
jgi:hypothetical protein